jgi:hypothetical protein
VVLRLLGVCRSREEQFSTPRRIVPHTTFSPIFFSLSLNKIIPICLYVSHISPLFSIICIVVSLLEFSAVSFVVYLFS